MPTREFVIRQDIISEEFVNKVLILSKLFRIFWHRDFQDNSTRYGPAVCLPTAQEICGGSTSNHLMLRKMTSKKINDNRQTFYIMDYFNGYEYTYLTAKDFLTLLIKARATNIKVIEKYREGLEQYFKLPLEKIK